MAKLTPAEQARYDTLPEPGSAEAKLDAIIKRCDDPPSNYDAGYRSSLALDELADLARIVKEHICDG